MESDSFIFCQENLKTSSFSAFEDMRKRAELVDFKVTIQDRIFFAHRLVLAAGILYLRTTFATSADEIPLQGIDADIFEDVINFAYNGNITISTANVQSLLVASKFLQLTEVHDACVKYVAMRLNVNNVFEIRSFAGNVESLRLTATCDHYILRNFETFVFANYDQFLSLPFDYMKYILKRDDLNVRNEEKVFEAVVKWVKALPSERHALFPELLCSVRMTHLTPQYLVESVSCEVLVLTSSHCKYLVEEIKNYHLLPTKPTSFLNSLNTHPRNTTGHGLYAIGSSILYQDNFVEFYDSEKGEWIPLAPIRKGKIDVVGYKGKIYIFGNSIDEIETFDLTTLQIERLNVPECNSRPEKSFQRIILHNNKFYACTSDEMHCFDPKLKKWKGFETTIQCEDSGIVSMGVYIYVTGGRFRRSNSNVSKRYNPTTGLKSEISPMLVERWNHECAALNSKMYVCGGYYFTQSKTVEVYDPLIDQWNFVSPIRSIGYNVSMVAYQGKLHALGNLTSAYDPEHNEWKPSIPKASSYIFIKYLTIPSAPGGKRVIAIKRPKTTT